MHVYTEEQIAALRAEAQAKGCALVEPPLNFAPTDAEPEDAIVVYIRTARQNEAAEWLAELDETERPDKNHAKIVTVSVDGKTGGAVIQALNELSDLSSGWMTLIAMRSMRHLGLRHEDERFWASLNRRTTDADIVKMGFSEAAVGPIRDLMQKYNQPGELRMVQFDDLPSVVVRRPKSSDETDHIEACRRKSRAWAETIEYAFAHIAYPVTEAERRALLANAPAMGINIKPVLSSMRSGDHHEGKAGRSRSGERRS